MGSTLEKGLSKDFSGCVECIVCIGRISQSTTFPSCRQVCSCLFIRCHGINQSAEWHQGHGFAFQAEAMAKTCTNPGIVQKNLLPPPCLLWPYVLTFIFGIFKLFQFRNVLSTSNIQYFFDIFVNQLFLGGSEDKLGSSEMRFSTNSKENKGRHGTDPWSTPQCLDILTTMHVEHGRHVCSCLLI